jgi:hypothetical protein
MRAMAVGTIVGLCLLTAATLVAAQSLADVARTEAERRKAVATPGKLFTNEDLRGEPSTVKPDGGAAARAAAGQAASTPVAGTEASLASSPAPVATREALTETGWRQRVASVRDARSRAELVAGALQSYINALTTDAINRDDPVQRALLAEDRQKALAELERVRQEIHDHDLALAAILEAARRAGVPAGWLREPSR